MLYKSIYITCLLLIISACSADNSSPANTLKSVNKTQITVSGLSSGGYMASQFHLANSEIVDGVGVLAAGPYYCARGDIMVALAECVGTANDTFDIEKSIEHIVNLQRSQRLANQQSHDGDKVWIYHGDADTRVNPQLGQQLFQQYQQILEPQNVTLHRQDNANHHFPTTNYGSQCELTDSPFLGNCNFDGAGEMLSFLLGPLNAPKANLSSSLQTISQKELIKNSDHQLADTGYVYIPSSCQTETCRVHINFHGCNQNAESVGDVYMMNNGLLNWADANNLIVLYPQTKASKIMPMNPQACWDWWGYTGEHYADKQGPQILAIMDLLNAL